MAAKPKNPWVIASVVGVAAFMEVLDISIANVALQHIAGSLSATQDESTWILTSYLVTNAIILLMSGWLSNTIGRKKYFIGCIGGFGIASLMCGLAPNLALLIVFRGIQGLIGGGLQPVSQAILTDAFPASKRGMAFSVYGLAVVFAPAIGPTLGGWITDNYTWRWVFLINVPISLLLTFFALTIVPPDEKKKKDKKGFSVDYMGFFFLSAGMGCLQVVLDRGQIDDWFGSTMIIILSVVAVLGWISFISWELMAPNPLVDLKMLKNANFAFGNILMLVFGGILLASTVLLPQFGQEILGYTATEAGKIISPGGILLLVLMPVIGMAMSKLDIRYLIFLGLAINIFALLYMTNFWQEINYWTIALSRVYQAAGLGFLFIPISTLAFEGVPKEKTNSASAIVNMIRNLGGSIGISIVTAMLQRRQQVHQAYLVEHITQGDPSYLNAINRAAPFLSYHISNATNAALTPQAIIFRSLEQQARVLAYIDDFQILAAAFVVLIPFLFFVRKPKAGKAQATH